MAGRWQEITVGEFAPFNYGKGLRESSREHTGSVPVFGSNGIIGFHNETLTVGPAVIIGRKGTVGAVHYSPVPCWPIDTTFFVTDNDPKSLRFKYYFLKSLGFEYMNAHSAVPGLNREAAHARRIRVPPLPNQHAIAHILGTLDDKIELNRRMNETLEAMAQAIFKSWFVDFDPVHAKAEGYRQGKISEIAALVCDSITPGQSPDETFDYYSIPAFDEGGLPKTETGDRIQSNKFVVPHNAVLLSKLNPRIPRVWLPKVSIARRSLCSTEFLVVVPRPNFSREYIYGLLGSQSFLEVFTTLVTGTSSSHQRVKADYLLAIDITIPPTECVERFTQRVKPLHDRVKHNLEESLTLAATRDALLPKLISGEIRVKDSDKFLREVTDA